MHRTSKLLLAAAAAGAVVAAGGACVAASATGAARPAAATFTAACATAPAGQVRCLAEYRSAGTRPAAAGTAPAGYGPADLRSAYHLPDTGGTGTIAIVDAFGYPTAEADLAAYRSQYGLPACTVASGCLTILNQRGDTTPLPAPQPGWAVETALDLDMASAACPACPLLLVQADDPAFADMGAAVDTAVAHGAAVVSNSYGASEFTGMDGYAAHYSHPGVPMLVASGDHGFSRANFPANLDSVIAVGGTSLTRAANARGWTEQAWSGSGSGCSAWIDKPAWQHDPNCDMRTTADISAVADPHTGVAVYDTFEVTEPGWLVVGGTSAASPFVAGVIALSGHAGAVTAERLYAEPSAFFDVVGGSNGYCGGDYLCTGLPGYDAPTGLGSPNGLTPFA
ncbi:MAG: S8 family serine peptidase [Mycobacteriales bacterium]